MPLTHIADLPGFRLDPPTVEEPCLIIVAHSTCTEVHCPTCVQPTTRTHGQYIRRIDDVPWGSRRACLRLLLHRFRCVNMACPRQTFVEPLPTIAPPYARRTRRLADHQQHLALALGGEAGARLADRLSLGTSPDTLLRLIRAFAPVLPVAPKRVGIDDWAIRKRQRYGTIIIDLDTHRPLDLLPDRDAESVAAWLQRYPTIEIISRDRAAVYSNGATAGAPQAQQVADRFHLISNVGDVLMRLLDRQSLVLRTAARQIAQTHADATPASDPTPPIRELPSPQPALQRQQQCAEVKRLHGEGWSLRQIGIQLGINRRTARVYLHADQVPVRVLPQNCSHAAPYLPLIYTLWGTECTTYQSLHTALQPHGFTGSYSSLRRLMHRILPDQADRRRIVPTPAVLGQPPTRLRSVRQTMWLLVQRDEVLTDDEREYRAVVCALSPTITAGYDLAQRFLRLVRERDVTAFDTWLMDATASASPAFANFARSLRQDEAAVRNAVATSWSNGPVEGHVHRLKMIKRTMYGRANFDLLRKRVLAPG